MPIYEYKCDKCGKIVEKLQKKHGSPPPKCEKDDQEMRKVVSVASFSLKGGGWYADGYS